MPFSPRFQEAGEYELIDSLLAVIHRDMKAALDAFYLADNLPHFAASTLGEFSDLSAYPLLVIDPQRTRSLETDDGFYLNQEVRIGGALVVKDSKPDLATRKAAKYMRALKAVVRTATSADLLPASNLVLDHVIDIDHNYRPLGKKGSEWVKAVEFIITMRFGEK